LFIEKCIRSENEISISRVVVSLVQPAAKSRGLGLDLEFPFEPNAERQRFDVNEIEVSKLLRACGGCLGAKRRRRTWVAAKSSGELPTEH